MSEPTEAAYEAADTAYLDQVETLDRVIHNHNAALRAAIDAAWPLAVTEGYQQAITYLRDDQRYRNWWTSNSTTPDGPIRRHLADYLETIAKDLPGKT